MILHPNGTNSHSVNGHAPDAPMFLEPRTPAERLALLHRLLGEPACRQLGVYPIPTGFKLSVVIPVYNEERWIREVVRRVRAVDIPKEIIIVDDCSTDGTRAILQEMEADDDLRVIYQPHNQGKGAALREGFRHATGDVVIVQDADLEYDPDEYPRLIQPILEGRADVVYGSRFIGETHRVLYFWHSVGQQAADADVEHVHRPEPDRHGNLLQGVPPRGASGHHAQVGSLRLRAGDHGQDRRKRGRPGASTRSRSATRAAPTRRARRSASRTPSTPSGASCVSAISIERRLFAWPRRRSPLSGSVHNRGLNLHDKGAPSPR